MKITGRLADRKVYVDGRRLSPAFSQRVFNHSPGGFSWGYPGSGPAQLALAILLEVFDYGIPQYKRGDPLPKYLQFKWDHVTDWSGDFEVDLDPEELKKDYAPRRPGERL